MREILAGVIVGYGLALVLAPVAALTLLRLARSSAAVRRAVPERTNLLALIVVVHAFAMYLLAALGLVLGLALKGMEDRWPDGGMGSPNAVYTGLVAAVVVMLALPLAVAGWQWRGAVLMGAGVAAALFGWALPWLAEVG